MNFDLSWAQVLGDWQSWTGHISYLILAASYLVTNMVYLRVLAAIALSMEMVYLYSGGDKPLWVGVLWSLLFVAINVVQLILIYREKVRSRLSGEDKKLRAWLFPNLGDVDFHHLLRVSRRGVMPAGAALTTQGEHLDYLYVITEGVAEVVVNGRPVATLREGSLVGEVSFFREDVATATVVAKGELRALAVGRTELRKLMKERESLHRALHESMGFDLGSKLMAFEQSQR